LGPEKGQKNHYSAWTDVKSEEKLLTNILDTLLT
jgi:hypothetical protein